MTNLRIGHGYDVHRLVEGRPLILGGVTVPYEKGLLGHSDADVLTHAVMDALLGAAGLPDIGNLCITGIVNLSGFWEHSLLQTTRLYTVMSLADHICNGIFYCLAKLEKPARLTKFS